MNDRFKAFLMIDYDTPDFIKELHKQIPEEELHISEDNPYAKGIEDETHVTVVPCLSDDVDLNSVKALLNKLAKYELLLTNISVFENDDCDVLKCDAHSDILRGTNKAICDQFETRSEYGEYHPHVTIAYLKPGMAEKYKKEILSPLVILKPKSFHFSHHDIDGNEVNDIFDI